MSVTLEVACNFMFRNKGCNVIASVGGKGRVISVSEFRNAKYFFTKHETRCADSGLVAVETGWASKD